MADQKYVTMRLLREHYNLIKLHSLVKNTSIQEVIDEAIQEWLKRQPDYQIIKKKGI